MKPYCFGDTNCIYLFNLILIVLVMAPLLILFAPLVKKYFNKKDEQESVGKFFKRYLQEYIFWMIFYLFMLFIVYIMSCVFNNNEWGFQKSTCLSTDMSDWGDFATCLTTIFTLVSIFYAYRAFRITDKTLGLQILASRRASFDATFTQIFAQHKILYDKAMQHNDSILFVSDYDKKCVKGNVKNNIFSICKNEYMKSLFAKYMYMKCCIPINNIAKSYIKYDISKFWESFNKRIGLSVSVDFKNYLKYIHNEVEYVASQPDDVLNDDAKQRYIQLIQAQMNNDELLCYLINKVEFMYRHKSNLEEDTKTHAEHLKKFKFFIELCRGKSGHVDFVKMILNDEELNVSAFIDKQWILNDKS